MDSGPSVAGLPRSRGERAAWTVGLAAVVAGAAGTLLTHEARWIVGASFVVVGATLLHHRSWVRSKAWLRRHRFRVCDRCRYPLVELPDEGTCPECGTPYAHARIEARWRAAYRTYWKDPVDLVD